MNVIRSIILLLMLGLFLQGCGVRPPTVPQPAAGVMLKDLCDHYNVVWQWDGVTQVVLLEYRGNKAKALVGSNVVLLGKEKIFLSAPLYRQNSTIYVPQDFESKVLSSFGVGAGQPTPVDLSESRIKTIVLDPGHGGKDPGAKGPGGVIEKDVVLDIARRLKTILQAEGFKVIMTRDSDVFITLPGRTEIASKSDADIFVSIHANSNPSRKTQGFEVYYVKTQNKKDLDEEQRQRNERLFVGRLQAGKAPVIKTIVSDMMYNLKVTDSMRMADAIARGSSLEVPVPNRGIHQCRFFVVRNTLIPAVLVEVGYLTNRQEERKLNTSSYRQKVAEGIAHSLVAYATN